MFPLLRLVEPNWGEIFQKLCVGYNAQIDVKVTDADGVASVKGAATWVSGSSNGGVSLTNMKAGSSNFYSTAPFAIGNGGDWTFTVQATDTAGNTRTAELKVKIATQANGQLCGTLGQFTFTPSPPAS
jgi:hypothetical protein